MYRDMSTETKYLYLEKRSNRHSQELLIQSPGVRASTVWHDRYVSRSHPEQIAEDRDLPVKAVYEALAYCQENWELICGEKDREKERLKQLWF